MTGLECGHLKVQSPPVFISEAGAVAFKVWASWAIYKVKGEKLEERGRYKPEFASVSLKKQVKQICAKCMIDWKTQCGYQE